MGEHVDDPRFAAFYGLLVVEWRMRERLDAELGAAAGLSLSQFELVMQLHFKDGRRRMSDLAEALLLSRGGATRLVARAQLPALPRDRPAHLPRLRRRRGGGGARARLAPGASRQSPGVRTGHPRRGGDRGSARARRGVTATCAVNPRQAPGTALRRRRPAAASLAPR